MEKLLTFVDAEGDTLFSAPAELLPRAGDVVIFSMEARDGEKWNTEAWEDNLNMSGKEWKVASVWHEFRCMSIDRTVHVVFVELTPNDCLERLPTACRGLSARRQGWAYVVAESRSDLLRRT